MRKLIFDNDSNEIILDCMDVLERTNVRNKYKIISKVLPQYQARQIRHHYRNNLNLRLCKDALKNDEKEFIIQWAEQNQEPNGTIRLKDLIPVMEARFGKLYSENKIKNFWYPRKIRLARNAGATVQAPSNLRNSVNNVNTHHPTTHYFNPSLPLPPIFTPTTMEPDFEPSFQFRLPKMEPLF